MQRLRAGNPAATFAFANLTITMEIVYGPLLQLPRSFVKITNQRRRGHHRRCQMRRQQARRIFWPITAAPGHVCKHLLNLAIGGLVVAGQLRLWASESCSTCYTPES